MFDDIRRIVYDVLDENNIKHIPTQEYLLPVRIKENGKKYINDCLNVLSKDRLKEANKHFDEIKHETGKALYYYSLKNEVPYSSRILTFEKGGKVTQFFLGKKESIIKIWQKLQVKIGKKYLSE